jgi:hypothetical protein
MTNRQYISRLSLYIRLQMTEKTAIAFRHVECKSARIQGSRTWEALVVQCLITENRRANLLN